jgi:hypothetical protein
LLGEHNEQSLEEAARLALDGAEDYLNALRRQLPDDIATIHEELDGNWDARKLSLVPGSELIDGVLQKFGLRYRKDKDGLRLAELMSLPEVDVELVELLKTIAS